MWNKHAVWCQCALVVLTTMTLASIFSIQSLTVGQDIFWSVLFTVTSLLRFGVAEHRAFGGMSMETIVRLSNQWSLLIDGVIIASVLTTFTSWTIASTLIGIYLGALTPYGDHTVALALVRWPDTLSVLVLLRIVSRQATLHQKRRMVGTSVADVSIKRMTLGRTCSILIEAGILWHLRCYHRFPHVYRYRPILFCLLNLAIALCWCQRYVSETTVSHRAIIQKMGHGVTPSLNAIKQCPVCKDSVTSLDIEDAFD